VTLRVIGRLTAVLPPSAAWPMGKIGANGCRLLRLQSKRDPTIHCVFSRLVPLGHQRLWRRSTGYLRFTVRPARERVNVAAYPRVYLWPETTRDPQTADTVSVSSFAADPIHHAQLLRHHSQREVSARASSRSRQFSSTISNQGFD